MLIRSEEQFFSVFSSQTPRIGVSGAALLRAWHTACASGHAVTTRGTQPALRAREVRPLRGDTMASCLKLASLFFCLCLPKSLSFGRRFIFRCNILFFCPTQYEYATCSAFRDRAILFRNLTFQLATYIHFVLPIMLTY